MSTTGGNWKEFWLAASQPGGGDLELLKFHLRNGVDPNFQHPEMESTALFEAVGAGNVQVVEYLLKYQDKDGKVAVDPTIPSAYENQTPLELAMEMQHHAMIDMILESLPIKNYDEESKYCQCILVSVPTANTTVLYSDYASNITEQVLRIGHMVISAASSKSLVHENSNDINPRNYYERETGNAKFWSVASFGELPSLHVSSSEGPKVTPTKKIDTWFCFLLAGEMKPKDGSLLDLIESEFIQPFKSFSSEHMMAPKQVWLMVPSTYLAKAYDKQHLIWFVQHYEVASPVRAIVIPCSWWDNLWRENTSSWIDEGALGRLLNINEYDIANCSRRIYNHKLEQVPWAKTMPATDPATIHQWEAQLSKS